MPSVTASRKVVVVAGDLTIDWNLARIRSEQGNPSVWNAEDCTRASYQRGGAALLGDLIKAVAATLPQPASTRLSPAESRGLAPTVPVAVRKVTLPGGPILPNDPRFHHSYAMWSLFPEHVGAADPTVWRVDQFLGLDRDRPRAQSEPKETAWADGDTETADLVVLDDAALGFRDQPHRWPAAIARQRSRPWILVKMAEPVAAGRLWTHLLDRHADRLVAVMTANDLRRTAVQISQRLSWERTAQDLVRELTRNPVVNNLSRCAYTIVSFGTTGAVLMPSRKPRGKEGQPAQLLFDPELMEGAWEPGGLGRMIGYTGTLTASIARQMLLNPEKPDLVQGIRSGVAAMRRLYAAGYGTANAPTSPDLAFPIDTVAAELARDHHLLSMSNIPDPDWRAPDSPASDSQEAAANFWTILGDRYPQDLDEVAQQIVAGGLESGALADVPIGRFGKLVTVDRHEIEALRSIDGLIAQYCQQSANRPLSIAVFGPPGSGKSFGVEQVANSVRPGEIKSINFNLSQFGRPEELLGAFHQVRDIVLSGKIPLVFWDEFDTPLAGQPLGWLGYFLAPMQDGTFQEGQITHPIGRCIFVFAGGTCDNVGSLGAQLPEREQAALKVRDFVGRLKGFLTVPGPNRRDVAGEADRYFVIRRAILLRSILERSAAHLFRKESGARTLHMDAGVLRAFLRTCEYKHGARSMESIVAMSQLAGQASFERSALPAEAQLDLHVHGRDFLTLMQEIVLTPQIVERLAEAAHQVWAAGKRRDRWKCGLQKDEKRRTHPWLVPYRDLPELAKEANRVNVRTIPQKLAAAGYVMIPARSKEPVVRFPASDLERLARYEHELWMQAKLAAGFTLGKPTAAHPKRNEYLVGWEDVPAAIKRSDRDLIKGIPMILAKAGYTVVKDRTRTRKKSGTTARG